MDDKFEITLTSYDLAGDYVTDVQSFDEVDEEIGFLDEWIAMAELEHETFGYFEHYVDRYDY